MNIPGAGVLEQTLPALPLDILPDLPVISNVKAAYADPSTRLVTLLGVYSVGAIGIANTKLIKSAKAKKLVSTLGKASGVAAIALYLADQMDGDDTVDVDPVSGLGFLGRARTGGGVKISQPAFASRAVAQHQAARNAAQSGRYRVERRRRGAGIPGGASDPVVVIKRIRRVIRQGGYGDAANYSYAGYGMEDYGAYGETAGQKRRRARRAARRARRAARRRTRIAARRSRRALRRRPLQRPPRFRRRRMIIRPRRVPSFPIENRVAPSMSLEAQDTPSYMLENQVDPSASIQQAEDAIADEFDTGAEYDDGGGVPMSTLALGGAALVGVALFLRSRQGKGKGKGKGKR